MSQAQTFYLTEWYASDGLPGSEPEKVATVADGSGNLYVAGVTLNAYEKYDLHLAKYDDEGDPLWTETFNLTDTNANVIVGQMILDNSGNPVITGTVYNGPTNRYDALTVKFNTSGVYQWHELYNGSGNHDDGGADLYSDSNDNIYIVGGTTDDTELMDFLVVAYESDGDLLWTHAIDGYGYFDAAGHIYRRSSTLLAVDGLVQQDLNTWKLGQQYITMSTGVLSGGFTITGSVDLDEIRDIVNDSDNNIYVTGYVDNGATNWDIVTLKLDDELNLLWSRTYNGSSNLDDEPHSLMVDEATGNVYVAGFTTKTGEGKNIAILRYNSSGTLQWGNSRNGQVDVDDEAFDVAIDTSGQIIVGGYVTEEGNKDYFVEILNSSGASIWFERFNGVHNLDDQGKKLTVETSGRISLTGKTGSPDGETYTTVRYTPKSILIPPDDEDPSSALYFTENRGQLLDTDDEAVPDIKFYSDRQSPALFFQEEGFSLVTAIMDGDTATNDTLHRVDVRYRQSKGAERVYALEPRADFHNYYLGHIPEGREKVGLYDRLIHTDAFTGIDIQYYSNNAGRKYYFVVKPGADPDDIKLIFDGQSSLSVNGSGDLVIGTAAGDIVLPEPEAFLVNSSGVESSVAWTPEFEVDGDTVTIGTEGYDGAKWLVIRVKEEVTETPENLGNLEWCTYYGGSLSDNVRNSTTDDNGNYYVVGETLSPNFPVLNSIHTFMGTPGLSDAFLIGFDDDLNRLFATFIGGTKRDIAHDVAFGAGGINVVGETEGAGANSGPPNINNFPLFNNGVVVYDGTNRCDGFSFCVDAFIAKFSLNGTRQFATFFGNDGNSQLGRETAFAIEVHASGFYVAGGLGGNVPVVNTNMSSLYENSVGDAFIASFNDNFSQLIWCSRFKAGVIFDIDTDDAGNVFIGGNVGSNHNLPLIAQTLNSYQSAFNGETLDRDGFMAKISSAPHELLWSTHYGGSNSDDLFDIKIDNDDNLLIAGKTASSDLDIFEPSLDDTFDGISSDGFIGKFNNSGEPLWTSYLGGSSGTSVAFSITVDRNNNIYVGLFSGAEELEVLNTGGFYEQELTEEDPSDAYLLVLTENASPISSTFLGYIGTDEIVSLETTSNKLYFAGNCNISPALSHSINEFPLVQFSANPNSYFLPSVSNGGVNPVAFMGRFDIGVLTDTRTQANHQFFLDVYPNPSNNVLFLSFYGKQDALGKIYTTHGQLVDQFKIGSGFQNIEIPVTYLPPGVYFITLISDRAVITRKVIIE